MSEKKIEEDKKESGILERFLPKKDNVSREEFEAWKDNFDKIHEKMVENLQVLADLQIKQNRMQQDLKTQYGNAIVIKMEHEVRGMQVLVGGKSE